jgi:hypothetical protein
VIEEATDKKIELVKMTIKEWFFLIIEKIVENKTLVVLLLTR